MNTASILGIVVGFLALILAFSSESSSISAMFQPSAALIVFGGTLGAVLLNFSIPTLLSTLSDIKKVFTNDQEDIENIVDQIIQLSTISRQNGLLSLQDAIPSIENKFLKRGLQLTIDINNTQLIHNLLTTEINLAEEQGILSARVLEAVGGYTPTFGVTGAVVGLIQVTSNLQDISQLAHGVAAAFAATLYGVGAANLLFLPIAGKLKMLLKEETILKEMILQGLISIHLGENPTIIEEKLLTFLNFSRRQNDLFWYRETEEVIQ